MASVTYTALREIEKSGYLKVGVDLTALASDDSFNSSSINLSGLIADQWVLTSGFASAVNNGWFQASGSSTSAKISQDTPDPTHLRLPGVSGNFAWTGDSAAFTVVDLDLRAQAMLTDWTPSAVQTVAAKFSTTAGNHRSWMLQVDTAGKLQIQQSADGTAVITAVSTVATGFADGTTNFIRVTEDVNDGSGNRVTKFWTSSNGIVWTQLGATITVAGVTAFFDSGSRFTIGAFNDDGSGSPMAGRVFYADVRGVIDGTTPVAIFDPLRAVRGATSFSSTTGETYTVATSGTPPAKLCGPALVTSSAGPSVTITGYKRGLGQGYSMDFGVETADLSRKTMRSVQMPIGPSAPEVTQWRSDKLIAVRTGKIDETAIAQWREFLASVEGGEQFTFDRYGTAASPVEPLQVMLESEEYSEVREGTIYPSRYSISFTVRVMN